MATTLDAKVTALEKRATAAESKLAAAAPAAGAGGDAELLRRLTGLREEILADQRAAEAVVARKTELEAENEKLKEEVGKLNYRIQHLLDALKATDAKK